MGEYRHKLSFSASHANADLSSLPKQLGMSAYVLQHAREARKTPNGRQLETIARRSYCSIKFEVLDDLQKSLEAAITKLKPHKSYLKSLSDNGAEFRFFVGWFSESWNTDERLSWTLLRDLSDLRISLDFDVYGPGEGDQ